MTTSSDISLDRFFFFFKENKGFAEALEVSATQVQCGTQRRRDESLPTQGLAACLCARSAAG